MHSTQTPETTHATRQPHFALDPESSVTPPYKPHNSHSTTSSVHLASNSGGCLICRQHTEKFRWNNKQAWKTLECALFTAWLQSSDM